MMKRALSIVLIVALLIGFGIYELISVNNIVTKVEREINEIEKKFPTNESNITQLSQKAKNLHDYWFSKEDSLTIIINHKDIAQLCNNIITFYHNVQLNNYEDALLDLYQLKQEIIKVKYNTGFNSKNIF